MSIKLIRLTELAKLISLSKSTIWRLVRAGRFPRAKRIAPHSVAWLESDVEAWMQAPEEFGPAPQDDQDSGVKP